MITWFSGGGQRVHRPGPNPGPRRRRPAVELLEDRWLPSGITEFGTGITPASTPTGITRGADGNLWFTEFDNNAVARITPSGTVTEFSLAGLQAGSSPQNITGGPNGLLFFTERGVGRIGSIDPLAGSDAAILASLKQSAVVPSGAGAGVDGITAGPDGNLWFTEAGVDRVGNVNTTLATINEFSTGITAGAAPAGIAAGPDGALWFTESGLNQIGRITTAGTVTNEFALTGTDPEGITAGPFGTLWFAENGSDQFGRITTAGMVTESGPQAVGSGPQGITLGPDGNIWLTETAGGRIARITPAGVITEFSTGLTANSSPLGITAGPDGNLWFAESDGNQIGRLVPDAPLAAGGGPVSATAGTAFSGPVASLVDGDPSAVPGDFQATISWGDGAMTTGTVAAVAGHPGDFTVSGTHTYSAAGSYNIVVITTDVNTTTSVGGSAARAVSTATVVAPTVPPPSPVVTGLFSVTPSRPRRQGKNRFQVSVTLRNISSQAVNGPIFLVLDNLSPKVKLLQPAAAGTTHVLSPLNSPFVAVPPGGSSTFGPGGSITLTLTFRSPSARLVRFTPRVLAGTFNV
jgi:streptogramin lyase